MPEFRLCRFACNVLLLTGLTLSCGHGSLQESDSAEVAGHETDLQDSNQDQLLQHQDIVPSLPRLCLQSDQLDYLHSRQRQRAHPGKKVTRKRSHSKAIRRIKRQLARPGEISSPTEFPLVINKSVDVWIEYFTGRGRSTFLKWLSRAQYYKKPITKILRQEGMPEELFYLALIESGLNPKAVSSARAVGPWQFMYATGMHYGLKINYFLDERRNLEKSTLAAATFLRHLYKKFGDWYLAAAAYNAGPGRVKRAIRKAGSRNFWHIASSRRYLSNETRQYVPKILAAIWIASQPENYGFQTFYHSSLELPDTQVKVHRPLLLKEVAEAAGVSYKQLRSWNPELKKHITPPMLKKYLAKGQTAYNLNMPLAAAERFKSSLNQFSEVEIKDVSLHKIRRGETLGGIAKRYRISLRKLMSFNPGINPRRLRLGKKLAVPLPSVKTLKRRG